MKRISQFVSELKRRNVFRAGVVYLVLAWLGVQIADILLGTFAAPHWVMRTIVICLTLGFPVTLALAWIYEITVEGVKRTEDVLPNESITHRTGRKLDFAVIGLLLVAVAFFAIDRFGWRQFEISDDSSAYEYSMAVLPFDFASDQIAPFFGQLSVEIIRTLQRSNQIRLASSDAVDAIPDGVSLAEIASRLGVRYIVSGILRSKNSDLVLEISLLDTNSDAPIWSSDFKEAQRKETTNSVAISLISQINARPLELSSRSSDPIAFELYLQARQHQITEYLSEDAEQLYRDAITRDAQLAEAYAGLCSLFTSRFAWGKSREDFERAERNCLRAWTIDEKSEEVQLALGDLYFESGQVDKAREILRKVLSANPSHYYAQTALAETHHDDNPALAETILRRLIRQNPGSPDAYQSLQFLFFKQGRYADAVQQQRWAVRLIPNDEGAKIRLSADLLMAGMFGEGKALLYGMLEEETKSASVENNLGVIVFFDGDFAEAARLFRNAIEREPDDPAYYRALGDAIWHLDGPEVARTNFHDAIRVANRHLEINPSDYVVISTLMVSYASIGDSESFSRLKKEILELAENDPATHYDIAVAASRLGDIATARLHSRKAHEIGFPVELLKSDPDIAATGVSFD